MIKVIWCRLDEFLWIVLCLAKQKNLSYSQQHYFMELAYFRILGHFYLVVPPSTIGVQGQKGLIIIINLMADWVLLYLDMLMYCNMPYICKYVSSKRRGQIVLPWFFNNTHLLHIGKAERGLNDGIMAMQLFLAFS